MTDHPQPDDAENQLSPFTSPEVAQVRDEETIERESLSWGGRIAWIVVALVVTLMITVTAVFRAGEESRTEATASDLFPIQLQARTLVGHENLMGKNSSSDEGQEDSDSGDEDAVDDDSDKKTKPSFSQSQIPEALNDGTYEQRLCYVLLIRESRGPDEAAEKLNELDEAVEEAEFELNEDQLRLRNIVGQLISSHQQGDVDAAAVSEDDREFLKEKLGWIGELGLAPEGTRNAETRKQLLADASWSMGLMIGFTVLMIFMMMAGVVTLAVLAVLFATEKLRPAFVTHGKSVNIYIETFAIWLVVFFGGPRLIGYLFETFEHEPSLTVNMIIQVGFFFGSLIVLVYPWLRGIPLRQLFDDIGWKFKGGFVDLLVSPVNYIAGMPVMLCGLICVLALTFLVSLFAAPKPFGTSIAAGHPIQDIITNGQWWSMMYIVLMACIAAPIVEETMFRGVLYRHLRELSGDWARWGSVIFSALFNGLIFAAIHPQGFTAIPLLTVLAFNFSLAREWRDSLIAPVIMHGINNGAVTFFMFLMI